MKSILTIAVTLMATFCVTAQKNYKASTGAVYQIGDTIQLGNGSGAGGQFVYLEMAGLVANSHGVPVGSAPAGKSVQIKKIKKLRLGGVDRVYFVVEGQNMPNYYLWIEDAIAAGEVKK